MRNTLNWFEIPVTDMARAARFYRQLFEVELDTRPGGGEGYAHERCSPTAGGVRRPAGLAAMGTFRVHRGTAGLPELQPESRCRAGAELQAAGGQLVVPKTDIGENGFFAFVLDTEGQPLGLHESAQPVRSNFARFSSTAYAVRAGGCLRCDRLVSECLCVMLSVASRPTPSALMLGARKRSPSLQPAGPLMRQKHFIDSHKAVTGLFVLLLMASYDQWHNPTAWIYLALARDLRHPVGAEEPHLSRTRPGSGPRPGGLRWSRGAVSASTGSRRGC